MNLLVVILFTLVAGISAGGYGHGYQHGRLKQFVAKPKEVIKEEVPVVVVTESPEYFTTTRYGPISSGFLRGSGDRSSRVEYTRSGSASGSLFSRDNAEATETASKTRGYEYKYRQGHSYEQPRTLYHYDIEEPIWGFADVDYVYTGEE